MLSLLYRAPFSVERLGLFPSFLDVLRSLNQTTNRREGAHFLATVLKVAFLL